MRNFPKEDANKHNGLAYSADNDKLNLSNLKKRIRFIGHKYSSLSGRTSIGLKKDAIQFESSLERDYVYLLEFNEDVKGFLEQPLKITYINDSKRTYTPDFLVQYHDTEKQDELVEIKYESQLIKNREILFHKFNAAKSFCRTNDIGFKVITEKVIRSNTTYLENIKFLSRYRNYFEILPKHVKVEVTSYHINILDTLDLLKHVEVKVLLDSLMKKSDLKSEEILFHLWYLIANNFIMCDLSASLNLNSSIWTD